MYRRYHLERWRRADIGVDWCWSLLFTGARTVFLAIFNDPGVLCGWWSIFALQIRSREWAKFRMLDFWCNHCCNMVAGYSLRRRRIELERPWMHSVIEVGAGMDIAGRPMRLSNEAGRHCGCGCHLQHAGRRDILCNFVAGVLRTLEAMGCPEVLLS
jgi:hypothetical protein